MLCVLLQVVPVVRSSSFFLRSSRLRVEFEIFLLKFKPQCDNSGSRSTIAARCDMDFEREARLREGLHESDRERQANHDAAVSERSFAALAFAVLLFAADFLVAQERAIVRADRTVECERAHVLALLLLLARWFAICIPL